MSDSGPQALGVLPKLALALAVLLAVAGVLLYGITWQVLDRIWSSMLERSSGPLSFRFILQPTMAAIAAIHDGLKDA